ncbi:MAG: YrdB family protein [Jiangellaceae bacterium]
MKAANLAVRFVLELCALTALGYWGARTGSPALAAVGLAIATPLLAATLWGLFVAPKARFDIPVVRWVVELGVFAGAAAGLAAVDRTGLAVTLLVVYAVNRTLVVVWKQEGARPSQAFT